ncbi:MAG TPA: exodeoxyribonuclease VII small subunit [Candidatus Saccharimonadales bacterium]|nr:exodeoxyribonuclease VII small subunit [Candidatus Saccharimonadales bacterium]
MVVKNNKPFADRLRELEDLLAWFESDEFDIDQAVENYEKGVRLVKELEEHLKTAENKVTKLKVKFSGK